MSDKTTAKPSTSNQSDEIDLGRLLGVVLDNRKLIIGVTAMFALLGILYAVLATPIYRADALVQVEKNAGDSILKDLSSAFDSKPDSSAEISLIQSRMVIGKTVQDLMLDINIREKFFPLIGRGVSRLIGEKPNRISISLLTVPSWQLDSSMQLEVIDDNTYRFNAGEAGVFEGKKGKEINYNGIELLVADIDATPGTIFIVTKKNEITAINDVLNNFTVADTGKDTGVLSLTLVGEEKSTTSKILNSIAQNYLQQNVERRSEEAGKSLEFLHRQLPEVREKLDSAENKLNQYRQQKDSVDLSLEAKSVLDSTVNVESQLNQLTFREAEISKLYTKEHPAYKALLEKRLVLENERDRLNKRVSAMPKTQQEILRLTRDVNVGQEVYIQLMNKQQELGISKASTVGYVRIIDTALVQPNPVKPKKLLIVVLFTLLGGVISTVSVIIYSFLHKGIESPEQLEELGINVYASIPLSEWQQKKDQEYQRKKRNNASSETLLAVGNPTDLAIEAIRSLRTSLHFAMLEAKNNVLMISGASLSIGKSFVTVNLGSVLAQAGQRVLIVDCDMRKGYSHQMLGGVAENGLSDILSGRVDVEKAQRSTLIDGLSFVPRGIVPPNPSELLMHNNFSNFINWASEKFDIVLLDTPPILAVTDAAIIGRFAGTSLLVARFEASTPKEVEISIRRFEQNGIDIKGVILNAVVRRALSYYSYGYDSYSYNYDDRKKK